jgi:hypothetical protein
MSLVRDYVSYSGDKQFAVDNKYQINAVGHVMTDPKVIDVDGLTWAKPDYKVKYSMDNAEVYRGMNDAAWVATNAWQDSAEYGWYNTHANTLSNSFEKLWVTSSNMYTTGMHADGTRDAVSWTVWYPASTAQTFPVKDGLLSPTSTRAKSLMSSINNKWPGWTSCNQGGQPFTEVARAAVVMKDKANVSTYLNNCQKVWPTRNWPYQVRHAGLNAETANLAKGL